MALLFDIIFFLMLLGLLFWLAVLVGGLIMTWWVKRRVNNFRRQFSAGDDSSSSGTARGASGSYSSRTTRTADGITIEDRRSPVEAQQKIFTQDEGEYVDFTEN